jgi:hypothetical protein
MRCRSGASTRGPAAAIACRAPFIAKYSRSCFVSATIYFLSALAGVVVLPGQGSQKEEKSRPAVSRHKRGSFSNDYIRFFRHRFASGQVAKWLMCRSAS